MSNGIITDKGLEDAAQNGKEDWEREGAEKNLSWDLVNPMAKSLNGCLCIPPTNISDIKAMCLEL